MVRAACRIGDRFALCRYEDLLQDGEPVMREITEFLQEPWAPEMLEHNRVQQAKGAPRAVEGSTLTSDPIDPRRADAWTGSAGPHDLEALAGAAPLARFFGYHPTDPLVRDPLVADGRHLMTGAEVARRRDAWSGQVDFEARPVAPVVDAPPEELAARLRQAEQALARTRSRRAVRLVDAARKVQHGRSRDDLRAAWAFLRRS
jgi:hypothetical protein